MLVNGTQKLFILMHRIGMRYNDNFKKGGVGPREKKKQEVIIIILH